MRKLRTLSLALFAAACVGWAVPASAATIYTLTANTSGTRTQLNPNTLQVIPPGVTPFNGTVEFDATSNGPVTNLLGLALITPLNSSTFLPQGGLTADIVFPANLYFAIGIGANTGLAAFGSYDSGTQSFDSFLLFSGAGLNNYDGISSLASVTVSVTDSEPFRTSRQGNLVGWNFANTAFSNAKFSAVSDVPEPATLTLFGAGMLGAAAMRRRKKQS